MLSRAAFCAKLPRFAENKGVGQTAAASVDASDALVRRSVDMILGQTRAGAPTGLIVAGMFGFIVVPGAGWLPFLAWYLVFVAGMLARQPYFDRLVAREGRTESTLFRIAAVAAFTGWLAPASVPLFAAYLSLADVGVLTIITICWVALAVSVLAVQPRVYAVYLAASLATVLLGWVRHSGPQELLVIGLAMLMGAPMMVKLAKVFMGQLRDTVAAAEENAQLVQQLQEALANQQEAQRARSRFLGAASHDLRQPVQALLFLSDIFRKSTDPARRDAMALQIARTGDSIDGMFRHLVDFAQVDAGTMKAVLQPVDLERLVNSAISGYGEKCAAKGLRFRLAMEEEPGTVVADPVLLERMLRNFLDNACKYSLSGEIVLRVQHRGEDCDIAVEDQGVGMDSEELAQACNAFYRGRSASIAEAEGIGLGLAISKHMADLMRARLELSQRMGGGTRVAIRLPRVQVTPERRSEDISRPGVSPLRGLLVAVVEDDRLAREALVLWLGEAGARVAAGSSLEKLQEALRAAGKPDFMVADFRLAEGNGMEAIQAVRARYGEVPALIISGEPDIADRNLSVPVLQKPVTPDRLLQFVRQALPQRRSAPADQAA